MPIEKAAREYIIYAKIHFRLDSFTDSESTGHIWSLIEVLCRNYRG